MTRQCALTLVGRAVFVVGPWPQYMSITRNYCRTLRAEPPRAKLMPGYASLAKQLLRARMAGGLGPAERLGVLKTQT